MSVVHVVRQGECFGAIAARHGFADWRVIYHHPENADLRQKRPDPNLLFPGDRVVVPEKEQKEISVATDRVHRVRVKVPERRLRVRILDRERATYKGVPKDITPPESEEYQLFSQTIAADATHVYWINASEGTVSKAPKGGGAPVTLASGVADPVGMTIDDTHVYFTVRGKDFGPVDDRAVAKVPRGGGAIEHIVHGPLVSAYGIAVDAAHAYWTANVGDVGAVATACK